MRQSCFTRDLEIQNNLQKTNPRTAALAADHPLVPDTLRFPSHASARPDFRSLRTRRRSPPSSPPQAAPLRPRAARPQLSPFSKKLITARVLAVSATPGPAEGAEAPLGEGAAQGEGEPLSAILLSRFLLFLEDMIRRQPGS